MSQPLAAAQRSRIRHFKSAQAPQVPILDADGVCIGSLRPIDRALAADPQLAQHMARWRQQAMHAFLTRFEATPERTHQWLVERVVPDDTRILFLICDTDGRPVGHYGVCHVGHDSAELDNVLRGERAAHPQLMYFAELALLAWLRTELGIQDVYLHVLADNARAIALYESAGFVARERRALRRLEEHGEVRLEEDPSRPPNESELCLVRMSLERRCAC
jgi:RimJ/RimL family protein N-acetyltransferase